MTVCEDTSKTTPDRTNFTEASFGSTVHDDIAQTSRAGAQVLDVACTNPPSFSHPDMANTCTEPAAWDSRAPTSAEAEPRTASTSNVDETTGMPTELSTIHAASVSTTPLTSSAPSSAPSVAQAPPKTAQEMTIAQLKAQKSAMLASLAALPAIQVLMEEHMSTRDETTDDQDGPTEADIMRAANQMVKDHIKLLHEYNELKDVGQGLMGLIADQRGVRIIEVQEEFGIDSHD
ncbi:hypothetical protein ACEQ8H_000433 [Pleosporales sp. CAS-2024a]